MLLNSRDVVSTCLGRAVLALLFLLPTIARISSIPAGAAASQDRAQPTAAASGSSGIAGVVVSANSGHPVRQAHVLLRSIEARAARFALTDDQGRFAFPNIQAGHFMLSASKPGFLDVVFGQRQPGSGKAGTAISLSTGQRLERITLTIPRGGALQGVIWDDQGEPAFRTQVRALRYAWRDGEKRLQVAGTATADDRGVYRIPALTPGEYVVMAVPTDQEIEAVVADAEAKAAAAGGSARFSTASADDIKDLMVAVGLGAPAKPDEILGFAPVFYPGTLEPSSANIVTLGVGQELTGLDITLQRGRLSRVAGVVSGGPSNLIESTQLALVSRSLSVTPLRTAHPKSSGQFSFGVIGPGQYTILARTTSPSPGASRSNSPERWWGASELTVNDSAVSNVHLALRPCVSVSGSLTFEDSPPPRDTTRFGVTLTPVTRGFPDIPPRATVDPNGRFSMYQVIPGMYRIALTAAPRGFMLKSAEVAGRDVLDAPIEIAADRNVTGVSLVLTTRNTQFTGVLTDDSGRSPDEYTLIVFADDARYWQPPSRRVQAVRPASDGRFSIVGLPAGSYRFATVVDVESGQWTDPEFLRQIQSSSTALTLGDGEKKVQDIALHR